MKFLVIWKIELSLLSSHVASVVWGRGVGEEEVRGRVMQENSR